ncbi:MAG: histidine kinase dimerization/phospho-acceptor domain-containing protein [Patescibacteria group bacterium]
MNLDFTSLIIYILSILVVSLGVVVLLNDKKNKINQLFAVVSAVTAYWIITNTLITLEPVNFWVKHAYATGIILTPTILTWVYYFIHKKGMRGLLKSILWSSTILLYFLSISTNLIIANVERSFTGGFDGTFGILFPIFGLQFILISIYILYLITKAFIDASGIEKRQYGYVASGLYGFGFIVGIVNFILPILGITSLIPLDSIGSIIFISAISLAILRHHLFNIKVIAVELVTFTLWIVILIRTVLSETREDIVIQGSLFVVSVVLGIVLIRSVLSEIRQREQIEKLAREIKTAYGRVREINEHLEERIADQTRDVRRAYEVEKRARAELEQLNKTKDEFITSTQHNLRTPLTSLKWELESIRKGTAGPVGPELKSILDSADESAKNLGDIIENFIKITERGV